MVICGMEVIFSPLILRDTEERLFPASRHRSKRICKKLIKRFGGEFRKVPCMYIVHGKILAHPVFMRDFDALPKVDTPLGGVGVGGAYSPPTLWSTFRASDPPAPRGASWTLIESTLPMPNRQLISPLTYFS